MDTNSGRAVKGIADMIYSGEDGFTLRERAERLVSREMNEPGSDIPEEPERLIYELRVHQVELEMQNEELRAARDELEESRDRYAALYDEAPVGYLTLDPECRIVEANLTAADLLGVERQLLPGRDFYGFVGRAHRDGFRRHCDLMGDGAARRVCELELVRPGGGSFYARLESVRSGGSEKEGLLCRTVITDITGNRRLLDQLEEERSRLKAVIDCAPEGILVTDDRARILMANSAAERLYVRPVPYGREMESSDGMLLCRPDGVPYDPGDLPLSRSARRGEVLNRVDVIVRCPDRRERVLLANTAPIRDSAGRVRGAVGVFQDFTERRRAVDLLRLSEARYRAIVEDIPLLICRHRPDGTITFVNAAYAEYRHCSPEDLIGADVFPLLPEKLRDIVRDREHGMTPENSVTTAVSPVSLPGGGMRWERWIERAIFDHGLLVEYQAAVEDITEQYQMEEALRESELRFRTIIDAWDNVAIQGYSPGGVVRYWNSANEKIFGYSAEEAMGENLVDLIIPPEGRGKAREEIRRCAATGEVPPSMEVTLMRRDGSAAPVYASHACVRVRGKEPELFSLVMDISELAATREALRESEERLRLIVENSPDTMFIQDRDLRYLWIVNSVLSAPEGMLVGKTDDDLGGVLNPEERRAAKREALETGEIRRCEVRMNAGGERIWHEAVFVPRRDGAGKVIGLFGYGHDITEYRRAEEALRESERRYRIVSGLTTDYACAFRVLPGAEVELEWIAGAFTRITGYTREEWVSAGWEAIFHPRDIPKVKRAILTAIREGRDSVEEHRIVNRSGGIRWLLSSLYPERDPSTGGVARLYITARDNTVRRALERKVERLRREQEALAAHEVKNLLIPMHIYVESLLAVSGDSLSEEQNRYLGKLRESTDKAFDFIQYFTRIHDLETGTFTLKKTRVPLEGIVSQAVLDLAPVSERSGVTVEFSSDGGNSDLDADVLLMPGVFTNLILNAIEHVATVRDPAEKTVRVILSTAESRLTVKIHNRGKPIPPERLETFFERFNPGEGKRAGVGLGTTYALLVARAHGGEISVASSRKEGTTVIVWFG